MDALSAEDLSKSYGETQALDDVSLAVPEGEVFALVGPNGAGKTTFVRCLTGTTTPDAGTVELLGESTAAVDKGRLGLLPQEFSPPDRLTARELVEYYAGLYDEPQSTDMVLESVGLTGVAGTRYANLSGGQRRRVCVGAALTNEPDVLFLDEPTTGIDPAGRRTLWTLLEDLSVAGTTVFLTTHYMEEAARLADRVGILVDGELEATDTPEAIVRAHGGSSRLHVRTRDAIDLDEYRIERDGEAVVIHEVAADEIAELVQQLAADGVDFESLIWRQPDLESAYLALTGEEVAPSQEAGR